MSSKNYRRPVCQKGIALITVMLVLAVVTVALVAMSSDRQMDIRRTQNQIRAIQAWSNLHSLETWAEQQLRADLAENGFDADSDIWNKPPPKTPIAQGEIEADIIELQGRLNLNNLLVEGQASDPDVQRLKVLVYPARHQTRIGGCHAGLDR